MLVAFVSFSAHAKVNVKKIYKTDWLKVETEHFQVVTNAKSEKAELISTELEQYYYFVSEVLKIEQKPLDQKVTVLLAKSDTSFKMFGIREDFMGVYSDCGEHITIFANVARFTPSSSGRSSEGRQTILHELAHFITYNTTHDIALPTWFSEGMAEYLATYVQKEGHVVLGSTNSAAYWPKNIRPSRLFDGLDVESLLKSNSISNHSNANVRARELNEFYAYSFGMVHYLAAEPMRRAQAFKYLQLLNQQLSVDEAFEQAFDMSFAEMNQSLKAYLTSKKAKKLLFDMGEQGFVFPEFQSQHSKLEAKSALKLIVNRINAVGAPFVSAEDKEIMLKEAAGVCEAFKIEEHVAAK